MISHQDQLELFKLISQELSSDVTAYAFGGTAMMFYGYKDETKDIDILFKTEKERKIFIETIGILGYSETSPKKIYIPEKLRDKNRPLMFKRGNSRFDLFSKQIFRTILSERMQEDLFSSHEFKSKHTLTINVLKTEFIVLLKGITEREKDFEDILNIIQKDKNFNWKYYVDEVIWQFKNGDSWVLLDSEETMQRLKKYVIIEDKYFKQIHDAPLDK